MHDSNYNQTVDKVITKLYTMIIFWVNFSDDHSTNNFYLKKSLNFVLYHKSHPINGSYLRKLFNFVL